LPQQVPAPLPQCSCGAPGQCLRRTSDVGLRPGQSPDHPCWLGRICSLELALLARNELFLSTVSVQAGRRMPAAVTLAPLVHITRARYFARRRRPGVASARRITTRSGPSKRRRRARNDVWSGRRTLVASTSMAVSNTQRIVANVVRFCLTGFRRSLLGIRAPIDATLITPRSCLRRNDPVRPRSACNTRASARHGDDLGGLQSDDATNRA
jgi:hypothetical protein